MMKLNCNNSKTRLFRSPVRSYYGSCGEGSPGESSDDYLEDLIEIKEEGIDAEEGTEELSVAVDLAKLRHVSKSSDSDNGRNEEVRILHSNFNSPPKMSLIICSHC